MAVLAVCLDAADRRLVDTWVEAGELPAIAGLIERGAVAELSSGAEYLPESVWPVMSTGCGPGTIGHYNFRCIRPGSYSQVPAPHRSHRRSIWELVAERDGRAILLDVPYARALGDPRVIQLNGWGFRGDRMKAEVSPPGLREEAVARHGAYPAWLSEDFDRNRRAERRHLSESLRMVGSRTGLVKGMLDQHDWDLAIVTYWETHNAAHMFHHHSDPSHLHHDAARAEGFEDGLLRVYKEVDRGLGEVLSGIPSETDVAVFSLYGLRSSSNGREILPRVFEGLGYTVPRAAPPLTRAAHAARSLFPWAIRRHVNARLSSETKARITERMYADSIDWGRSRAFVESEFGHGWIHINVRGREPEGTVERGEPYERLCDEIAGELGSLVEAESGEPAITEVVRTRELFDGPHVEELPDLLVRFRNDRMVKAVRHPRLGLIEEDMRDIPKSEHTGEGFMIAAGPQVRRGDTHVRGDIVDVAPTLLHLLGLPAPEGMEGHVLEGMLDPDAPAARPPAREPIPWEDERWAGWEWA